MELRLSHTIKYQHFYVFLGPSTRKNVVSGRNTSGIVCSCISQYQCIGLPPHQNTHAPIPYYLSDPRFEKLHTMTWAGPRPKDRVVDDCFTTRSFSTRGRFYVHICRDAARNAARQFSTVVSRGPTATPDTDQVAAALSSIGAVAATARLASTLSSQQASMCLYTYLYYCILP